MDETKGHDLQHRWTKLDNDRKSIISLCEEYAKWTLPYIFPYGESNNNGYEMQLSMDSIGAQSVNHLSNKVVSTLFPPQSLFFRLHIEQQAQDALKALMAQAGNTDETELADAVNKVDDQLAAVEKKAQDHMDMISFRPQAVRAAQLLIITGNALAFHPPDRTPQVYSLRDYCLVRDLSGEVIEIMTREAKAFETFHPDIQKQIRDPSKQKGGHTDYKDDTDVVVYTQVRLENDGKFKARQCADHVHLDIGEATWPKSTLPWIPLTWNLARGEDYGRGLVGDYAGAFHAVNTLTGALLNIAAIMGDIKFLVKPSSLIDIAQMNQSPPGSYHSGNPDDIATVKLERNNEAQFIQAMIERYEKQISQAFLLMSTRQAERVTAEEIRQSANELETSNGGIYSRLASTWQQPLANIVLDQIDFQGLEHGITPKVVTGMDSLSRTSELDNLRMFMGDVAMLQAVPEPALAAIDFSKFMAVIGKNRQVEYKAFLKTDAQKQQEQEAAMQQQAALEQQKAGGAVAAEAGKAAVQGAQQ